MRELVEQIESAVADDATDSEKAKGAAACRLLLAKLEPAPLIPAQPAQPPMAQLLDAVIARLRAEAGSAEDEVKESETTLKIPFVPVPR